MKKIRLLIIISWLWARLKWTLEISRLAIVRMMPNTPIHEVAHVSHLPSPTFWICEKEQVSCINIDQHRNTLIIYELPPLSKN